MREAILSALPLRGRSLVIEENQQVSDIIQPICYAHEKNRGLYDTFADSFDGGSIRDICKRLWTFCKKNLRYQVQTEEKQTVRSPARILRDVRSDCKHYASFVGGVLDALRRKGKAIDWCYRFAGYRLLRPVGHVFVVVTLLSGEEIWIDPVLETFNEHIGYFKHTDTNMNSTTRRKRSILGCTGYSPGCSTRALGAISLDSYESGAWYGKLCFDNQNLTPGAGDAYLANPPVTYWVNGQQLILPKPNATIGGAVPPLPAGLQVRYAPSFMGVPIPSVMPSPTVDSQANRLYCSPAVFPGMSGDQTNATLLAHNKLLLNIVISAFGAIISCYSSYPYANPYISGHYNPAAFGTLSSYILTERTRSNYLISDPDKGTFFHQVLSTISNTVLPIYQKIAPTIANAVIPGSGAVISPILNLQTKGLQTLVNAPAVTTKVNAQLPSGQLIQPAASSIIQPVPSPTSAAAQIPATGSSGISNKVWLLAAGVTALLFFSTHKKKSA